MRTFKLNFIALAIASLLFSCDFNSNLFINTTGNPFLQNTYDNLGNMQELVIVTDVHIGRENHSSGITRYDDVFETFLKSSEVGSKSALISLGDLVDKSKTDIPDSLNFIKKFAHYCSNTFVGVIGNHETHETSMANWEDTFSTTLEDIKSYSHRMAVYKFNNVSIYVLDNAKRILGQTQLNYLEEAMKQDTNPVKIVLSHENIMTGNKLDQSLFMFGNPSVTELTHFTKILEENGVSLVLTGHTHNGNFIYKYGENCYEMNLAAYHAKESTLNLESKGYWYTLSIDESSQEIVVKTYLAKTGEITDEHRFSY